MKGWHFINENVRLGIAKYVENPPVKKSTWNMEETMI